MYSLIKSLTSRTIAIQTLMSFAIAFGIAELFYKWKSFALETLGFLATWFVLDFLFSIAIRRVRALRSAKA